VSRARVAGPGAVGALEAALGGDDNRVARRRPRLAERSREEPFAVADIAMVQAVDVGRVEERGAGVERRAQRADAFFFARAFADREVHAADADGAHVQAAGTEGTCLHGGSPEGLA
jgi:hypothetical protein